MEANKQTVSTGSAVDSSSEPNIRIVVPEQLHLHISLEGMPDSVSALFQKLAKGSSDSRWSSRLRAFFKDYLPALTPIATAVFAGLVGFYGSKFNDQLTRDTLEKITTEFVEKRGDNIAAMKLAAYGDKALPAVWIALGSDDPTLRNGAVKIAKQMYFEETVEHKALIGAMLKHYRNNPGLRLGILEFLGELESADQLSPEDSRCALGLIKDTFGSDGQQCAGQGADLAGAAADFLSAGSFPDAMDFVRGMDAHCPKDFTGVHKTLQDIAGSK
jgi:hypothetical protein